MSDNNSPLIGDHLNRSPEELRRQADEAVAAYRRDFPEHFSQDWPVRANQGQHVKQAKDRAQYVRQQQGHSLIKHLLLGIFVLWIPAIYYTFSPNHYWHA